MEEFFQATVVNFVGLLGNTNMRLATVKSKSPGKSEQIGKRKYLEKVKKWFLNSMLVFSI